MSYLALLAADGEEEDELPPAVIPAAPPAAVTVLEPAAGAVAGSSGGSAAAMASCVHPVSPTSELAAALNAAAICSGRSCSDASGGTMPADAAAAAAEASQQQQQQQQSCGQQLSSYASLNSWFDVDGFNAFESVYGAAAAAADQHQHHPAVALQLPYDDAAATPSAAVCDEDSVGVALLPLSPPFSSSRADSAAVPFRFSSHQNRHDSSSSHVTALPNQLQPQTDCVINAGTSGAAAAASAASQHQLQQAWWPPPAHGRSSLGPLAAGTASAIAASRQHISAAFQYSLGHICNAPLEDGANAAPVMAPPPPLSTLESSAAAQQQQAYHSHRLHDKTSAPGHQTLPYSAQRRSGQVQPHADPSSSLTLGPAAAGSSAAGSGFHHHSGSRVTTTTTTTTTTVFQSSQALQHQLLYQPNTDYSNGGNLYHNQHGAVPAFCTAAAAGGGGSSTEALSTAVDQLFHNTAMQQRDVAGTLCANYSYPNAPAAAAAAQHYAAPYSAIAAPSLGPQAAYRQGAGGKIRSDGVFSAGGGGALPGALTAAAAAPLPVAAGGAASGPLPVVEEVAGNASGRGGGQEARQKHPAAGGVSGSGSGRGNVARKSRANLPASVVRVLRHWLLGHIEHPYPTEPEKQALCSETEITLSQLNK